MTFVIAGLYALLALTAATIEWVTPGAARVPLGAFTALYVMVIALLAGALASAEERHVGTLEWQLLLPMAARRQWALKAGAALACALLLGYGLPALLVALHPGAALALQGPRPGQLTVFIVLLTSGSLYVSSLSTSGVKALVVSLAALFGALTFVSIVTSLADAMAPGMVRELASTLHTAVAGASADARHVMAEGVVLAAAGGLAATLLRFAMINHRTAGPGAAVVLRQLTVVVVMLAASVFLLELSSIALR